MLDWECRESVRWVRSAAPGRTAPPAKWNSNLTTVMREKGYGVRMGEHLLQFVAWAGPTWLLGKNPGELNDMVRDLEKAAARHAGMSLRLAKCTRTEIRRPDQPATVVPEDCVSLGAMQELPEGDCMRVLGAPVHPQGVASAECV